MRYRLLFYTILCRTVNYGSLQKPLLSISYKNRLGVGSLSVESVDSDSGDCGGNVHALKITINYYREIGIRHSATFFIKAPFVKMAANHHIDIGFIQDRNEIIADVEVAVPSFGFWRNMAEYYPDF